MAIPPSLLCGLCGSAYVGSLYLLPASTRALPRDHPVHIKGRFASVGLASLFSVTVFVMAMNVDDQARPSSLSTIAAQLGVRSDGLAAATVLPLVLVGMLFLGPLATLGLLAWHCRTSTVPRYNGWSRPLPSGPRSYGAALWAVLRQQLGDESELAKLRNLVVGPFSEELVFRACMLPLLTCGGWPRGRVVGLAPLFFGIAHAHHFVTKYPTLGVQKALLVTMVQLAYTYVFGLLSAYIFLRTGHLIAPTIAHTFCNFMGLPDVTFMSQRPSGLSCLFEVRYLLLAAYLVGIGLFFFSMAPLTDPGWYSLPPEWPCRSLG